MGTVTAILQKRRSIVNSAGSGRVIPYDQADVSGLRVELRTLLERFGENWISWEEHRHRVALVEFSSSGGTRHRM